MMTLDQINQQSNEEKCENERTEQVEEQICGGQSAKMLVGKKRNEGWGEGGGRRSQILYNLLQMIQDELAKKDMEKPVNLRNVERSLLIINKSCV